MVAPLMVTPVTPDPTYTPRLHPVASTVPVMDWPCVATIAAVNPVLPAGEQEAAETGGAAANTARPAIDSAAAATTTGARRRREVRMGGNIGGAGREGKGRDARHSPARSGSRGVQVVVDREAADPHRVGHVLDGLAEREGAPLVEQAHGALLVFAGQRGERGTQLALDVGHEPLERAVELGREAEAADDDAVPAEGNVAGREVLAGHHGAAHRVGDGADGGEQRVGHTVTLSAEENASHSVE